MRSDSAWAIAPPASIHVARDARATLAVSAAAAALVSAAAGPPPPASSCWDASAASTSDNGRLSSPGSGVADTARS
jgi:hypothetical protein